MGAPSPEAEPDAYAQLRTVPDHLVELIAGLIHQTGRRPDGPPVREQAREYAERIWGEAVHAGAVWGMARGGPAGGVVAACDAAQR